jgi:ribosomal protein S18 acetylase RimI-like enzyme
MTSTLTISAAAEHDAEALVQLVNSAYRGESSRKGWTTEANLLDGIRTDVDAMIDLMNKPGSVILQVRDNKNQLVGCVNLQRQHDEVYLGMLTVLPDLQGGGIGKELLKASERYALENDASAIVMSVISIRKELIAWYERHGYAITGERKPFPTSDPRFGIPKQSLEFVILRKTLQH